MKSSEIRTTFLQYFERKKHKIVSSAPMVIKDDPTLMFTNAGMNQFKELFLGNAPIKYPRVANTQKCLRVSGKHNDLEEVGHDTYHHTMFEMLGNWSFGDPAHPEKGYFKKEAIAWAWELLTGVFKISKEDLYATVFEGDNSDGLEPDKESYDFWKEHIPESHIFWGSKKDNFWEMGNTGPCGPCSEIHIDIRDDAEKKKVPAAELINKDHPEVIEIWNLVFIEFNRLADGKLEPLKAKHVDTGMGFERLTMVLQGVKSNYDTDIFRPVIDEIAQMSSTRYGKDEKKDIAMRVVADHLRAIAFAIADGALPSNIGAGYVIRRILRRAVRYGYTFLGFDEPFIYKLMPVLVDQMGGVFPELEKQQKLIEKVMKEEETAFLRTLAFGIKRFEQYIGNHPDKKIIAGDFAFELFDTFGFPVDLTRLLAREKGYEVDMEGFNEGLEAQKSRSRKAAEVEAGDWVIVKDEEPKTEFVGYDQLECEARVLRYRKVITRKKEVYEVVLDRTPFYAESGGQVGDKGVLISSHETLQVLDTKKEHSLIIHLVKEEPQHPESVFLARVDEKKRLLTMNNHSATHLMHAALRKVLGKHVEQKGSYVDDQHLRFDFSYFGKMTDEQIREVENLVNDKVRENVKATVKTDVPIDKALEMGAMALFGEKYGDRVRVVIYDPEYSVELCGGTHVPQTGQIGLFKITSESAIAAGVRRIEAVTGRKAEKFVNSQIDTLKEIRELLKKQPDVVHAVQNLVEQNKKLQREVESLQKEKALQVAGELFNKAERIGDALFVAATVNLDVTQAKDLAHKLRQMGEQVFVVLALQNSGKVNLVVSVSDALIDKGFHAGNIIREVASHIKGGGGGQPHLATAGGKDAGGIGAAFDAARKFLE
ncbi:MAG: alanine--tRNA ligase [Chlorobi bacterium]|nr:alanine--tRNA ligase [Chlorobiota bacterium]